MIIALLALEFAAKLNGITAQNLMRRGGCWSSSCSYNESFEEVYRVDFQIFKPSAAFICTELETKMPYVCKFSKADKLKRHLPIEITVLEAIQKSREQEKILFIEMHEYFYLNESLNNIFNGLEKEFSFFNDSDPETTDFYVVVLEFYGEKWTDGSNYLIAENMNISEKNVMKIFKSLVIGIKYLHSLGYSHSDIKRNISIKNNIVENFLVNIQTLEVKILDFNLAQNITGGLSRQFMGTPGYYPPEILKHQEYLIEKAEVWQLGIILYTLMFSEYPFIEDTEVLAKNDIKQKIISLSKNVSRFQLDYQINLLTSMFSDDPELRPTLDEILIKLI